MSNTGRFYIQSIKTGKVYCVEPGLTRTDWGSIDPATGEFVNKKGFKKYQGGVAEKDSIITEENGFTNIVVLQPGESPLDYIEKIDEQYYTKTAWKKWYSDNAQGWNFNIEEELGRTRSNADWKDVVSQLLLVFFAPEHIESWLNNPHSELNGAKPIDLINAGKGEIVYDMLMSALDGGFT